MNFVRNGFNGISLLQLLVFFVFPIIILKIVGVLFVANIPVMVIEFGLVVIVVRLLGTFIGATTYVVILLAEAVMSLIPMYHLSWESARQSFADLVFLNPSTSLIVISLIIIIFIIAYIVSKRLRLMPVSAIIISFVVYASVCLILKYMEKPVFKSNIVNSVAGTMYGVVKTQTLLRESKNDLAQVEEMRSASQDIFVALKEKSSTMPKKILFVVVESLGYAESDGNINYWQYEYPLQRLDKNGKYEIKKKKIFAKGSTIPGEIRELCGKKIKGIFVPGTLDGSECLPNMLHDIGYDTVAFHGYKAAFFDRLELYKRLGFEDAYFGSDILGADRLCGYMFFSGICDDDVADNIRQYISKSEVGAKQFIYWLTLNSHQPILGSPKAGKFLTCEEMQISDKNICWLVQHSQSVINSIIDLSIDFPKLSIVIVGDHVPAIDRPEFDVNAVPAIFINPTSSL